MAYCERCERPFNSQRALDQHIEDSSSHWLCSQCDKDFETHNARLQHFVNSREHSYCRECEEDFDDDEERDQHMEDEHWWCSNHDKVFKNERGLKEHYRQSPAHHYCVDCDRPFNAEWSLRQHLNSKTHRTADVPCPFNGCGQAFVSKSALVSHLENGGCRSGVNRRMVDNYVRQLDRDNIITTRLLTDGDSTTTFIATNRSWNGRAYQCYFCHAPFRTLVDLNKHLASPRHQARSYRCPMSSCGAHFNTLSGLCQHIESETCGVHRFQVVQNTMDSVYNGMRRLTM
ncbi:hypothetical protein CONPUDRAFT_96469 [Coniophora puteana RWD-64-598 SS2]|uniref:C2H2-type domain-containing protein n=1 Tax=Coniophora puteana (strain RWD-64-598) TaxID=741705 RepID=A0A5M3N6V3_CONPW|nr:uncharacterized protein CONPUDRAFT_96469 [Coniophora puteana RWD-64-598 SS2]EIW87169.1 hypothetical protein CONPUDRAFT_96469 [Coniophora puteana RWD-64-598 SS2]